MTTSTRTLTLGSMLLGSTNAPALREWYRTTFAPDHEGDGPIELGGFHLVIDERDDVSHTNGEPGRVILNFHVDDIDEVAARLDAAAVTWRTPVEDRGFAKIGTFLDPDGNYLQLVQFAEGNEPA